MIYINFKSFFKERSNVFGLHPFRFTIKDDALAVCLDAQAWLALEEGENLVVKEPANSVLAASPQDIAIGETRVGLEIDVLISNCPADLVEKVLRPECELRRIELR